jgi:hypothetical protein
MTKLTMALTCFSVVGHFDGHGNPPVQYEAHRPMQHVQGYYRSHWMLPSGNYLLCIATVTARATVNETTIKKCTKKTGRFDGCGGAPVRYRMHCPIEEV